MGAEERITELESRLAQLEERLAAGLHTVTAPFAVVDGKGRKLLTVELDEDSVNGPELMVRLHHRLTGEAAIQMSVSEYSGMMGGESLSVISRWTDEKEEEHQKATHVQPGRVAVYHGEFSGVELTAESNGAGVDVQSSLAEFPIASLYARDGKPLLSLAGGYDENSIFQGCAGVDIGTDPDHGESMFRLRNLAGEETVTLGNDPDACGQLILRGRNGETRQVLPTIE